MWYACGSTNTNLTGYGATIVLHRFPHNPQEVKDVRDFLAALPPASPEQIEQCRKDREAYAAKHAGKHPLQVAHDEFEEGLNVSMGVKGWKLKDIPFTVDTFWDQLLDILGDDNVKVISLNTRTHNGEQSRRGSLLVAPEGMRRLTKHVNEKKEAPH